MGSRCGPRTQKPSEVKTRLHLHAADAVRQHRFRVGMYDAVDSGIRFQYLAVDAPFFVSLRRALSDR